LAAIPDTGITKQSIISNQMLTNGWFKAYVTSFSIPQNLKQLLQWQKT
jgi:hypothetical protein